MSFSAQAPPMMGAHPYVPGEERDKYEKRGGGEVSSMELAMLFLFLVLSQYMYTRPFSLPPCSNEFLYLPLSFSSFSFSSVSGPCS